jgi:hypothetical protein
MRHTAGREEGTMRDEDVIIMYSDLACPATSRERRAEFRMRVITTGASWRALYRFSADGEMKSLSGVGPGPDIFAVARQALAERERTFAPQARAKAAGFEVLQGGVV